MPYSPFWFETFGDAFPWLIPLIAVSSLWLARASEEPTLQRLAERAYFAALLLVAWGTLRTIISNDCCWLPHTFSMGAMIIGGVFPFQTPETTALSDV